MNQGLARRAAAILRERDFDAIHVVEIGMEKADDSAILDKAFEAGRVCITLDHDFHANRALTRKGGPSVILLRIQGLNSQAQADLIQTVYTQCEEALLEGAAVSADRLNIRVRRLPLR